MFIELWFVGIIVVILVGIGINSALSVNDTSGTGSSLNVIALLIALIFILIAGPSAVYQQNNPSDRLARAERASVAVIDMADLKKKYANQRVWQVLSRNNALYEHGYTLEEAEARRKKLAEREYQTRLSIQLENSN